MANIELIKVASKLRTTRIICLSFWSNLMSTQVSVIIPNYNCLKYLETCINSIYQQNDVNFEIIIVDDGSTDGSIDYLQQLAKTNKEVRLFTQNRKGVVAARNLAITQANSEYVAFLDADDYWSKDKLAKQLAFHNEHPECVLSFTDYMHFNEKNEDIISCFDYWPEFDSNRTNTEFHLLKNPISQMITTNIVGTSSVMVKRAALIDVGGFDHKLTSATDLDCWLKIAKQGDVAYSSLCAMHYLMRANSITANRENRLAAMVEIIRRNQYGVTKGELKKIKARLSECYGEFYRELGNYSKALSYSNKAFWLFPHKRNFKHVLYDLKHLLGAS